jgi:phytoene dehydrogenase-like protein
VTGIRFRTSEGEEQTRNFSRVVTDLDIYFVYRKLLPSLPFPERKFRHERSTSALIFYWGMKTVSPQLDLHNILFSGHYREEFDCLFRKKIVTDDPTVYIFISSKAVISDAPDGCENWFVMINVPANDGQDWDEAICHARLAIERKILRMTGIDVVRHRQFEFISDPRDIENRTASYRGSLYGNSSNSIFAAFSRHPNFSAIRGLYHTGGSVHPGGGIPLCLASAGIVAGMIPSSPKMKKL